MKAFARALLGATMLPLLSAIPAVAGLNGEFTLFWFSGPSHQKETRECVIFTNTGTIAGFPDSGTWVFDGYAGAIGGNFAVVGNTLHWYGTVWPGTQVLNFYNSIKDDVPGKGGYDTWVASAPPITTYTDGTTRLKAGCQ